MSKIESIPMAYIKPNKLNLYDGCEDQEQINVLADSIQNTGLTQPLVVYKNKEKEYILLGGHKRYEALKKNGVSGMKDIPCLIQKKPADELEERERLLQFNLSRKTPEELEKQVTEANNIWNTMPSNKRKVLTDKYKKEFIKVNGDDEKNINNNFRPRLDYIRYLTGLTVSNRTVSSMIKRELEKTSEAFSHKDTKKEPKQITIRDIILKATALTGLIELYEDTNVDGLGKTEMSELRELSKALKGVVENLG